MREELDELKGMVQALSELALRQNEYLISIGHFLAASEERYKREHYATVVDVPKGPQA